jgi:IS30 family transposase
MTYCYRHLTVEDRAAIMMMRTTQSIRTIACHLGRAPSTVSREIARHTIDSIKGYDASLAGYRVRLTRHRPRQRPKLHPNGELFEVVVHLLRKYWSPQQIARTLKRMSPNDSHRQVSHEAIYNAL